MFLRWKKRKFTAKDGAEDVWLSAQIVESHRIDGKPRQKVIRVLGEIRESHLPLILERYGFWVRLERNLQDHPMELPEKVKEKLMVTVKEPTMDEVWEEEDRIAQNRHYKRSMERGNEIVQN